MRTASAWSTGPSLAALAIVLAAGAASAQSGVSPFDHLKCYKIKDFNLAQLYTLDLVPEQTQFLTETGCVLKSRARYFCIDVQKTNVQPTPPGPQVVTQDARDYLCYKLKCPKTVPTSLVVGDQFGQRDILVNKIPDHLCVPAEKQGVPPKPTPTGCVIPTPTPTVQIPTPTATRTPGPPCLIGGGPACAGDCSFINPAFVCLFKDASAGCQCEPPTDACTNHANPGAPPICGGLCPNQGQQCLQTTATDCGCVP